MVVGGRGRGESVRRNGQGEGKAVEAVECGAIAPF